MNNEKTIGIAIVGCGQIVTHHCKALSQIQNVSVRALCDPSKERRDVIHQLCEQYQLIEQKQTTLTQYHSLQELLHDKTNIENCDLIFIAVPHDLHVSIACQALDAGKHVLMEKPLAPTMEECHTLQKASQQSKGFLLIAEQSPYWQEIEKAKEMLSSKENAIGSLITAASYYYESMRDNVTSGLTDDGGLGWRCSLKKCGGGIVIDGGLHWIRPLRELCGDITSVIGVKQNCQLGLKMEGETLAHALFKIRNKYYSPNCDNHNIDNKDGNIEELVATYSANMMHTAPMCHDAAPYFRLTGTKGELIIPGTGLNPNGGGGLRLYNETYPNGHDLFPTDRQGGFFLGFQGLWKEMLRIIKTEDRDAAHRSVRNAAADVALVLALYKSSESGQWEKCELFD